ncbi:MAG: hypothetical protein AMXMBFR58_29370 [Phycisphaerae bacterium]
MKCLTICQPWAWAIVGDSAGGVTIDGPKRIENRPWLMTYRGPLLIHAGKSEKFWGDGLRGWWDRNVVKPMLPAPGLVPWGSVCGVAYVHGAYELRAEALLMANTLRLPDQEPFASQHPGAKYILFSHARAFEKPVPWRGQQFLFDVPESAVPEVDSILRGWGVRP